MAALINGLGGDSGFGENVLTRNDDGYSDAIDITSVFPNGINLFTNRYTSMYVNTNGNITFDGGLYSYTPGSIDAGSSPIFAAFWADVDTRSGTVAANNGSTATVDTSLGAYRTFINNDTLYYDSIDYTSAVLNYNISAWDLSSLQAFDEDVKATTGWDTATNPEALTASESLYTFLVQAAADIAAQTGDSNYNTAGNSTGSNLVWYDLDPDTQTITVTWDDVGYYNEHMDKTNAFQLQLKNVGDGNFDISYIYEDINWTTGDASDGVNGLGGTVARAGYSAGDGEHYYELPFSGSESGMLGLDTYAVAGTGDTGIWKLSAANGSIQGIGLENSDDELEGTAASDILSGRSGNDILRGGLGDDSIDGGEGDDILDGGDGNDVFFTGTGNDTVIGGAGIDKVVYTDNLNKYSFTPQTDRYIITDDAATSTDTLQEIEDAVFADVTLAVELLAVIVEQEQQIARLYSAVLGRNPDNNGLTYWLNDMNTNGSTIQNISGGFAGSDEYLARFGAQSDADFINQLYNNILSRDADQAGYDYWMSEINSSGDRTGMIVSFSNSSEYEAAQQANVENFLNNVDLSSLNTDTLVI
ncbi:nidogen-like domain-containing protein [Sulfurimonas sp. NWX367]|uniref:nidogen-like domain-containing protein n=1 Tax=Sulfurimonas sp. NWX367 TaxID=2925413 RepID=UPI003204A2EA